MTQVRRPLVAALALFTVAIALDRTGVGQEGADVIGSHAYVIAALSIVLPSAVVGLRRSRLVTPITAALGLLLVVSAVIGTGFFGDPGAHIAAIEVAFVGLAAGLGHTLGAALEHVDRLVTTVVVGESPAIDLEGPRAANEIHTEVARSRRHDRPLSVTVLSPTRHTLQRALDPASVEVDRAIRSRFLYGRLAQAVGHVLRRSDLLFEHRPTGRLIVLSPETDADGAALLLDRITTAVAEAGIETSAGTASFPGDGIGFETLVDAAERHMMTSTEAQPRLRAVDQGGRA